MKLSKIFCLLTALLLIALPVRATEAYTAPEQIEGTDLTWSFDESSGFLTISGTGDIPDYSDSASPPWLPCAPFVTGIVIGEGVTGVGDWAFNWNFWNVTSVSLPSTLKRIGDLAFGHCSALTNLTLPESLEHIGEYAFSQCFGLTGVTIPGSVSSIGAFAFSMCSGLTQVTIDPGTTCVGRAAFAECSSLSNVTIANTVTEIGQIAFAATALRDVTLPSSVSYIGTNAFGGCEALENVSVLNPHCTMEEYILGEGEIRGTISGFAGSTAQDHAGTYGYLFRELIHCEVFGHAYSHCGVAATCTEQGYTEHVCNVCGDTYRDSFMDALGHDFTEWVQTKAPTQTETGLAERQCQRCTRTEQQVLPMLTPDPTEPETTGPVDVTEPETQPETQPEPSVPETTVPQQTQPEETRPTSGDEPGKSNAVGVAAAVVAIVAATGAGIAWLYLKNRKFK